MNRTNEAGDTCVEWNRPVAKSVPIRRGTLATIRSRIHRSKGVLLAFVVWEAFFFVDGVSIVEAREQGRLEARQEVAATARMLGQLPDDWLGPAEGRLTTAGRELWTQVEEMAAKAADPVAVAWSRMTHSGLGSAQVSSGPGSGQSAEAGDSKPLGSRTARTLRPRLRRSAAPPRAVSISESSLESGAKTRAQSLALGSAFAGSQISDTHRPALRTAAVRARTVDASSMPRSTAVSSLLTVPSLLAGAPNSKDRSSKVIQKTIAPEITALAASLENSPARIFRHIHDSIDYDPKWGVDSPPLGTLWERRGTSWDQAWLLQELLIAAGVDARLEWGEVEIGPDLLLQITGVDDAFRAGDLLSTAGLPVVLIVSGGQVIAARMPHAWVKAHLDYIPNRGVTHDQGDTWIRLDPSLKRYTSQDATRLDQDVPYVLEDHLNSGTTASPRTDYETALQDHITAQNLGITLEQAKPAHSLRAEEFPFIPGTLRAKVLTVSGESMEVPGTFQTRFNLEINAAEGGELLSWSAPLSTVYGQLLEMRWPGATAADQGTIDSYGDLFATPPYEVQVRPTIRLGGGAVASGSAIGAAEDAVLKVTVTPPAGLTGDGTPIVASWDLYAGEHGALAFDFGRAPAEIIALTTQQAAGATDPEDVEAWSLSAAAATYLHSSAGDLDHLAGLNHHRAINLGTAVLAVQRGAVSTTPEGTPDTFSRGPLSIDVGARTLGVFAVDGNTVSTVPTLELVGSQGSVREGEALASVFGGDHVTAVGFLKEAVRQGQTLTRVDLATVNQALTAANLSSGAEGAVRFAVEQGGAIAWISQTQLEINGWRTTGYILEDPNTGIGGYFVTYEREFRPLEGAVTFHGPSDLDIITAPTDVVATMDVEDIETWTLSTRPVGGEAITPIVSGTGPVNNTLLGQFDPTLLLNGMHKLILTGRNAAGESITGKITLVVEGNMKIGHFTLSFVDLAIPLSGLDLEIIRTYDSRRRNEKGDFGYGWTLDIRQGSYKNNRPPGDGWQFQTGFLPCDSIVESKAHLTTIRLSDREVYSFRTNLVEGAPTLGGCFGRAEFVFEDGPVPGVQLEIVGNDRVLWSNGSDRVLDAEELELFEPKTVRLKTRDGRSFVMALDFGVTQVRDANGVLVDITPSGIIHSLGKTVAFERDIEGRISQLEDPLGNLTSYSYDVDGNLVAASDFENQVSTMSYDQRHLLLDITDPRGVRGVRVDYDEKGRMVRLTDGAGKTTEVVHQISDRREVFTNRMGQVRVLEYDERGNVLVETDELGFKTVRAYDHKDRMLTETDPLGATTTRRFGIDGTLAELQDPLGNSLRLTYDSRGFPTAITDSRNSVLRTKFDSGGNLKETTDPLGSVTRYTHDSRGNLTSIIDQLGNETLMEYDSFGNLVRAVDAEGAEIRATYDSNNRKVSQTIQRTTSNGVENLETQFTYDRLGRLIQTELPDGSTTTSTYDPLDAVLSGSDELSRSFEITYDLAGRPTVLSLLDGTEERRSYDAEGRLVSMTDSQGRIVEFQNDAVGRLSDVLLPDGTRLKMGFDPAGRLISSWNGRGGKTSYEYDAAGRLISRTDPLGGTSTWEYDSGGQVIKETNALGSSVEYDYDPRGQVTRIVSADGSETQIKYDELGRRTAVIDAQGFETRYAYDGLGRLIEVIDALEGKTQFGFDELDHPIVRIDALGRETRFEFDTRGRMVKTIHPDGATERFTYDAAGNLTSHTEASGDTTFFEYDAANRVVRRELADGAIQELTYTDSGKRSSATDSRGTTLYFYDSRDRLIRLVDPTGNELRYAYDADSNRTSLIADLGSVGFFETTTEYDAVGRPVLVKDPLGGAYATSYDAVGSPLTLSYPNGVVTSRLWDSMNRLVETDTRDQNGVILQSFSYAYSPTGQRVSVVDHASSRLEYSYDPLNRLIEERLEKADGSFAGSTSWEWDAVGNRIREVSTAADGSASSIESVFDVRDRLVERSGVPLTWNIEGQLESNGQGQSYAWSDDGRLREIQLEDGRRVESTYSVDGVRVGLKETAASGLSESRSLLVDGQGPVDIRNPLPHVVAETGLGNTLQSLHVRQGDQLLASIRGSEVGYLHSDGLGSIRTMTDNGGLVTDRWSYEAFGSLKDRQGSTRQGYLFAGEAQDSTSSLYYLRERWMDPSFGGFLSPDPFPGMATDPSTFHPYLYSRGEPVGLTDPTGLFSASEANVVMAQAANLSRIAVRLFQVIDKARSFVDMVDSVVGLLQVIQSGNVMEYIKQAIRTSFDTPNFGPGDVAESISRNIKPIFNAASPHWIPWLVTFGNKFKGLGMWLPNPGILPANNHRFDTGLRLKKLKVYLILQGKEKSGSLMGIGFLVNVPNLIDLHQMWRIDFHAFHVGRGTGGSGVDRKKEIDVWLDSPFHYHVLKPLYVPLKK